ncbi:uncharacterized protein DSM5745_11243 [Aspergillus mulundensis]|uniref:Protein kinase domain-containing protein n=1 Tax=Aspergillus mulundensis TaxID=1810919 RepID=A0A3D8Q9M9_9EURO|nr:hypothetical protein DSM5745_11243 [Aspergillus mulundensis]RDW58552.1 hypothetical protein DSM5745_11243 [Aspergillus mulundensis]
MKNGDLKTYLQAQHSIPMDLKLMRGLGSISSTLERPAYRGYRLICFGSTLYEVFQGASPYEDLPSDQVEALYKRKEFRDTSNIPCAQIIEKSWLSQVSSAEHVHDFIGNIIRSTLNVDCILYLGGSDAAL